MYTDYRIGKYDGFSVDSLRTDVKHIKKSVRWEKISISHYHRIGIYMDKECLLMGVNIAEISICHLQLSKSGASGPDGFQYECPTGY